MRPAIRLSEPRQFSTRGLPADKRVELWEGHNDDALFDLRCRTVGAEALEASMVNLQLDRIHLARVEGNPHAVERSDEVIRRRPADALGVYLTLAGDAFFYHPEGVVTVRPGQLLICDIDRPFLRGFSHGLEELAIKVPRPLFHELTGRPTLETPVVMDFAHGNAAARTLARTVGRAVRPADARPVEEETVLGLVGQLVTGGRSEVVAVHLVTAKAFIEEHLTDPNLTAARVAQAVGLSERHLSRIFAMAGCTVPQHILARRLERAHAMLAGQPTLSIAEAASRSGFGSTTYFSHAFRERFGERATDVRRRGRLGDFTEQERRGA